MQAGIRRGRILKFAIGSVLLFLGVVIFRRALAEAIRLVVTASLIALVLCPLSKIYERYVSVQFAAALSLASAIIIGAIIVIAIMIPLVQGVIEVYSYIPYAISQAQDVISDAGKRFGFSGVQMEAFTPDLISALMEFAEIIGIQAVGYAGVAADVIIAAVISWYMIVGREQLALRIEMVIPYRYRHVVLKNATEARLEIGMYLRGQATIALCVGIISAAGLFALRLPYAIPLGLTAGILNMIPYLGPIIACIPVGIIALGDGIVPMLLSICVLICVQQIDGLILSPRIVGNATGFTPAMVMIAVFAAGAAWGIAGMLAALPVLIIIRTCVRVFVELGHND